MSDSQSPYVPFETPIPAITSAPLDGALLCLRFSEDWLPYVLGALGALTAPQTYSGDKADIETATILANYLIAQVAGSVECSLITGDIVFNNDEIISFHDEVITL